MAGRRAFVLILVLCLVMGSYLRLVGWTRGTSDFLLPEDARAGVKQTFYQFHPDEETLVRKALELENPLHPPLTAYGMLPLYLARGAAEIGSRWTRGEPANLDSSNSRRTTFLAVRLLAVLFSLGSLWLVWVIGRRGFGKWSALVGTAFVAGAPLAVQQAHFFTVDGVFTTILMAAFYFLLKAVENGQSRHYVIAGVLIGATGAIRLSGLSLGLLLVGGHYLSGGVGNWRKRGRQLLDLRLWVAGAAALLMLVALQPFMVVDPEWLFRTHSTDDLAYSMLIAKGEALHPWSLVDVHTTPYLHYWTHLWPQGVGWPLTIAFTLSLGWAAWRRSTPGMLMVGWCAFHFLLVGGLHTKHVRYLVGTKKIGRCYSTS